MKVQQLQQQNQIKFDNKPQFKGAVDTTLRYLATNQAIGANGVDLCSMVAPRTASDTIKRGPAAGLETFRREIMGTVNDSIIGLFGAFAGVMLAYSMNKDFGFNVNKIFAAPDTIKILAQNRANQVKNNTKQIDYLKETLSSVKAYNPTAANSDAQGYVKLSEKTVNKVAELLDTALQKDSDVTLDVWTKDSSKTLRSAIMNIMMGDTGAQSKYIIESTDKKIVSETNLKSLLNDIFVVTGSFNKDKVKNAFDSQIKNGKAVNENSFIKGLSKFMKARTLLGFAMVSAIGLSVQPINMYLTKLKQELTVLSE
ncbi:hypothetical protein IKQ21_04540 [bacterium]|nr:hypothetical protein [bacterium]